MSGWRDLRCELARWEQAGRRLPFWWRDDDAVHPTAALDRLAQMSSRHGVHVHLAIIPARAEPTLAPFLGPDGFRAVIHGWSHENHAPDGHKSAEFGHPRGDAAADAARSFERMTTLFGARAHPMFVPPWNRIDAALLPELAHIGYHAVSTYGARKAREAVPRLVQINTHIDPVDWRGTRSVVDPELTLSRLVDTLTARRDGRTDPAEPLGLLTHHLMQDEAIWGFCDALVQELLAGPVDLFDIADHREIPLP
ncbi:polysaccharide deacetylase [Aliishimia ponticola]|uniref:Polysaccharide deacetylase n=1 Tax=Aliishimia ponticola TaxID=2499833 RepID=A0A4S4N7J5_9RHOB|nr:polysaccharide deacetylase [Aliishimia ponticola]THH35114.1 polysaccharide deacetylase [Aliishimia ponticola]